MDLGYQDVFHPHFAYYVFTDDVLLIYISDLLNKELVRRVKMGNSEYCARALLILCPTLLQVMAPTRPLTYWYCIPLNSCKAIGVQRLWSDADPGVWGVQNINLPIWGDQCYKWHMIAEGLCYRFCSVIILIINHIFDTIMKVSTKYHLKHLSLHPFSILFLEGISIM